MEYNNEAKLKEQSSRLTNSKKELAVTKGKGCRRAVGERDGRALRAITISTHGVGGIMGKTV